MYSFSSLVENFNDVLLILFTQLYLTFYLVCICLFFFFFFFFFGGGKITLSLKLNKRGAFIKLKHWGSARLIHISFFPPVGVFSLNRNSVSSLKIQALNADK